MAKSSLKNLLTLVNEAKKQSPVAESFLQDYLQYGSGNQYGCSLYHHAGRRNCPDGNGVGKPTSLFDTTHGGQLLNTLTAGIKSLRRFRFRPVSGRMAGREIFEGKPALSRAQIGRASCRERVFVPV